MRTIEEIEQFLREEVNEKDVYYMWNEYADDGYDSIFEMDEFNDILSSDTPDELARKIFYGDFCPNHNYFCFDGCANLKSSDYIEDLISYWDLARYIYDNECDFNNRDLQEFLEEGEEDNEEV